MERPTRSTTVTVEAGRSAEHIRIFVLSIARPINIVEDWQQLVLSPSLVRQNVHEVFHRHRQFRCFVLCSVVLVLFHILFILLLKAI